MKVAMGREVNDAHRLNLLPQRRFGGLLSKKRGTAVQPGYGNGFVLRLRQRLRRSAVEAEVTSLAEAMRGFECGTCRFVLHLWAPAWRFGPRQQGRAVENGIAHHDGG